MDMQELPFVRDKDYWCPQDETGDWGKDNAVGRAYARALVDATDDEELPLVFGRVMQAIIAKGHCGGIATGFFFALGGMIAQGRYPLVTLDPDLVLAA